MAQHPADKDLPSLSQVLKSPSGSWLGGKSAGEQNDPSVLLVCIREATGDDSALNHLSAVSAGSPTSGLIQGKDTQFPSPADGRVESKKPLRPVPATPRSRAPGVTEPSCLVF